MAEWIPDSYLDLILDKIVLSDEEIICSQQPTTYYNCIWPDLWTPSTAYVIGDLVHPPTPNGFVYECILDGSSGGTEPGWGTTQDQEFADGTTEWKTHENYSIANQPLVPGDFTKEDGDVDGRKLTVAQKMGVVTHVAGTVTHTAMIQHSTKELHYVTTSETTLAGNNDVESGRTTIFFSFAITIRDPQ